MIRMWSPHFCQWEATWKTLPIATPPLARDKIQSISHMRGLTILPLTLDLCVMANISPQK